jgi:hypothetical protein
VLVFPVVEQSEYQCKIVMEKVNTCWLDRVTQESHRDVRLGCAQFHGIVGEDGI